MGNINTILVCYFNTINRSRFRKENTKMEKRKSKRVKKNNEMFENKRAEAFEPKTQNMLQEKHSLISEILDSVFGNQLENWEKSRQRCCLSQSQFIRHLLALHDLYCCRCQSSYGSILHNGQTL